MAASFSSTRVQLTCYTAAQVSETTEPGICPSHDLLPQSMICWATPKPRSLSFWNYCGQNANTDQLTCKMHCDAASPGQGQPQPYHTPRCGEACAPTPVLLAPVTKPPLEQKVAVVTGWENKVGKKKASRACEQGCGKQMAKIPLIGRRYPG